MTAGGLQAWIKSETVDPCCTVIFCPLFNWDSNEVCTFSKPVYIFNISVVLWRLPISPHKEVCSKLASIL